MPRPLRTALLLMLAAVGAHADGSVDVSAGRQEALLHLLKHDCGACHGMTLRGGLGPSLSPDALRSRSEEQLVSTVLDGRPGTPMPPWRSFLSEEEARWLIRFLRGER